MTAVAVYWLRSQLCGRCTSSTPLILLPPLIMKNIFLLPPLEATRLFRRPRHHRRLTEWHTITLFFPAWSLRLALLVGQLTLP